MEEEIGFGSLPSELHPKTISYDPKVSLTGVLTDGGVTYQPDEIEHQRKVGICTAISLAQERQKANKKKYSPDFQYLLQKVYFDKNWEEGSSILSALRVAKNYGFLPKDLWTYTTEDDRKLAYKDYVAKLKAIPETEIKRLIGLCVDKIPGYAQVNVNDPMALAKAIEESKAGIICRFEVGMEWFTPTWNENDINPLQPPKDPISGHAIIMSFYNYLAYLKQTLTNTWGTKWCRVGCGDVNWAKYRPTEAWVILDKTFFVNDLSVGMTHPDVKRLQQFLNQNGFVVAPVGPGSPGNETEYFGSRTSNALISFQVKHGIKPAVGYFGIITRARVNAML